MGSSSTTAAHRRSSSGSSSNELVASASRLTAFNSNETRIRFLMEAQLRCPEYKGEHSCFCIDGFSKRDRRGAVREVRRLMCRMMQEEAAARSGERLFDLATWDQCNLPGTYVTQSCVKRAESHDLASAGCMAWTDASGKRAFMISPSSVVRNLFRHTASEQKEGGNRADSILHTFRVTWLNPRWLHEISDQCARIDCGGGGGSTHRLSSP